MPDQGQGNTLTYDAICRIVGRQFLESTHQINVINESATSVVGELRERVSELERQLAEYRPTNAAPARTPEA